MQEIAVSKRIHNVQNLASSCWNCFLSQMPISLSQCYIEFRVLYTDTSPCCMPDNINNYLSFLIAIGHHNPARFQSANVSLSQNDQLLSEQSTDKTRRSILIPLSETRAISDIAIVWHPEAVQNLALTNFECMPRCGRRNDKSLRNAL
jgi:hypothetical protein